MSSSFDLPDVSSFAAGTEGPPGQRVFYLQAVAGTQVVTLRLEKQQVALLASYLEQLLPNAGLDASPPTAMPDLLQPVIAEWVVGTLRVAIDELRSRIVIVAEELVPDAEPDPDDAPLGAEARFSLTGGQVEAFVVGSSALVASGRPPCRLCGRPVDPGGHFCPRLN